MLQILLLCISSLLYASQSSRSQPVPSENIFTQLNIRPTFSIPACHEQLKHNELMTLQSFLPIITPLLEGITLNKPLQDLQSLSLSSEYSALCCKQPTPFAAYMQHTAHTFEAAWRLQENDYAHASTALHNAFCSVSRYQNLLGYDDAPTMCIPLAAIVAEKLATTYPELLNDLGIPEHIVPKAYRHTAKAVQQDGPWTIDDVHTLQWYTALCQGKAEQHPLGLPAYTGVAEKIRALVLPEISEPFLHSQLVASIHANNINPTQENRTYVRTAAKTYSDYLYRQNPSDPNDRALQLLSTAADYGDWQAGIDVGEIFHLCSLEAQTDADRQMLHAHAEKFFKIVKQQKDNPTLAARAAFNLLKIPQGTKQNDISYLKSTTKRFNDFVVSVKESHLFAPLAQAYLVVQYRDLATLESSAHLKKLYQQRANDITKKVNSSGNLIARNFLLGEDLNQGLNRIKQCEKNLDQIKGLPSIPANITPIITKLNTMISGSTRQTATSSNSKNEPFNLDEVMAAFDHTIGFENKQHAAHVWSLRAQAELMQPEIDYETHQTCLRMAYKLAPDYPLTIALLRKDLNRLFNNNELQKVEEQLNSLDALCQTTVTLFWRGNLEQQKGNTSYALTLYKLSGESKAWYNAGAIYHHGDGSTIEPNLDTARTYYENALKLEPGDTAYCLRSLADIAAAQGRYQDQLELLGRIIKSSSESTITARDAYDFAKLLLSENIDNPNTTAAFKAFELTCELILQEKEPSLTAEQLHECSELTQCLELQTRKASSKESAELRDLAKKGIVEAYHALGYQQLLIGKDAAEQERMDVALTVAKFYAQQALNLNPTSKRALNRLARFTKPATTWCSFAEMSEAGKKDFEEACTLYERSMATKEPRALFAEASQVYASMLAHVCTEYTMAEERLLRAVKLGSSTAYLTLFKLYIEHNKIAECDSIMHLSTTFDDFTNDEDRARFEDCFGLTQNHLQSLAIDVDLQTSTKVD